MTIKQFNNTAFKAGMKVTHKKLGIVTNLIAINFIEGLIGIKLGDNQDCDMYWARCENVEIIE